MPKERYDVIIVGAGVVGCAIARELSKYRLKTAVLDRNSDVSEGISKANSGVVHAGFNVPSGTLKAKTNVAGFFQIPKLAEILKFPYEKTGKLVVGYDEEDLLRLKKLKERGDKNGCVGLEIIGEKEIEKIEKNARGKYALYSKETGIISPYLFTIALAENAFKNGVKFFLNNNVSKIKRINGDFFLETNQERFSAKWLINAGGIHSDRISEMAGDDRYTVYPCRGEYFITDKDVEGIIKAMIYPLPNKDGSGLGVHLTPTIEKTILIGPSAEYVDEKSVVNTKAVMEMLQKEAAELVPEIARIPIIRFYAGLRPKLIHPTTKEDFRDFVIEASSLVPNLINLIGIESPGLTASPAIAEMVAGIIGEKQDLSENKEFESHNSAKIKFSDLPIEEKEQLVSQDKDFGEIICRCETITRYEVLEALNNPLGVRTFDSVKRRCRAGMGRCQGGFCGPRLARLLIEEFGFSETEITKNSVGSNLFYGKIK